MHEYREEDVQEILARAARIESAGPDIERKTLLVTAAELGISDEALALAETEWVRERATNDEAEAFRQLQRREFFEHAASYVGVNIFLVAINLLGSSGSFWAIWPILGWGLGLYGHAATALNSNSSSYRRQFARFRERRRAANSN